MNNTTLVTGIWDLGRDSLGDGWGRSFDHYLLNFSNLLTKLKDFNLAIFIDPKLESFVWEKRDKKNTVIYFHKKEDFSGNFFPFFDQVQKIRTNPEWFNQSGWLVNSTQAKMEWYNPMVMSKVFLLHNASIFNPFGSDYYFWIDGGISNTVHLGYFYHDKVLEKIEKLTKKLLFICFPYEAENEVHGFNFSKINEYAKDKVTKVARGGFFGGKKKFIPEFNAKYYNLLQNTLSEGLMGTEESIFSILSYLDPKLFWCENINSDGLISTFFEKVKNDETDQQKEIIASNTIHKNDNVSLYINTFNSPAQLKLLLESIEKFEPKLLTKTDKILIDNSTNKELYNEYDSIVQKYSFKLIRQGNLGICRARQKSAEDFFESKNKYMIFFEDDMLLDLSDQTCPFGFLKNIPNFYDNIIDIMDNNEYDYLKFSFSEFYGHNGFQWSWHNVPEHKRKEYFGNISEKPNTIFNNIKSLASIPYADGEIYYSNWPHIINQAGNKKMFLDTTWEYPYEQTWMSHFYTLTKEEKIKPAILLRSPITHNRVYHYGRDERKEN